MGLLFSQETYLARNRLIDYDMKNIFCLFERPFEIQKNGVFLFEISFFVSEILSFLYYANQISDDVIRFATEKW